MDDIRIFGKPSRKMEKVLNTATAVTLAAMYIIPLLALVWLYKKEPACALIGAIAIALTFGAGGEF